MHETTRRKRHDTGLRVAGLALLAACGRNPGADGPPHIVLISIDTLRADHLSCYGYGRATSPRIDALARAGVRFERALSPTSWTLPAHVTMLTGLPISAHGACDDRLWDRRDARGERIPPPLRARWVSEDLAAAGYRTGGFYSWKYLDDQFGFGAGFEVWERPVHDFFSHPVVGAEYLRLKAAGDVEGQKALAREHTELLDPARRSTPGTVDRALEWLAGVRAETPEAPVFLFLHLFDAHDPYLPPKAFDRFADPEYGGEIDGTRVTSPDSPVRADMSAADLERLVSLYDGGIAWVDSEVGRFLDRLAALGLEDDTLVVVTSDHGEEFFEHGHKTHRRQLYMESLHVPLLMRWPGVLPRGRAVSGTVGLVDLAPTLRAAAGLAASGPTLGSDLLPFARGSANPARTYVALLNLFEGGELSERQVGLCRGDELSIFVARPGGARTERFDLAANARGAGAGSVAEGEAAERWPDENLARWRDAVARLRARLPERGSALPALSELDKSQLAALGYGGLEAPTESAADSERLCVDGCVWRRD